MTGPHAGARVLVRGPRGGADAALVMLHGRGAGAQDILTLVPPLDLPGWRYVAPEARGGTWYPNSFMAPLEANEPWLSSALGLVAEVLAAVAADGIPAERTILLGFSQGACLALEFAARNARRYGGLVGLSGGLIGPAGTVRHDAGSLAGTPVFLGCSDHDPHIPASRVLHAAETLAGLGGDVTRALYPDLDHSVSEEELEHVRDLMRPLSAEAGAAS
ncbi:MAG TPA: alpha/beta fold hydrolase [Candidatus Dormibacteraeota bacterium]|nr:alpha/beta fold hydrolase [Candidatus Dormibacteraeota bacterium]